MRRRKYLSLLGAVGVTVAIAGCGGAEDEEIDDGEATEPEDDDDEQEIDDDETEEDETEQDEEEEEEEQDSIYDVSLEESQVSGGDIEFTVRVENLLDEPIYMAPYNITGVVPDVNPPPASGPGGTIVSLNAGSSGTYSETMTTDVYDDDVLDPETDDFQGIEQAFASPGGWAANGAWTPELYPPAMEQDVEATIMSYGEEVIAVEIPNETGIDPDDVTDTVFPQGEITEFTQDVFVLDVERTESPYWTRFGTIQLTTVSEEQSLSYSMPFPEINITDYETELDIDEEQFIVSDITVTAENEYPLPGLDVYMLTGSAPRRRVFPSAMATAESGDFPNESVIGPMHGSERIGEELSIDDELWTNVDFPLEDTDTVRLLAACENTFLDVELLGDIESLVDV